jgi:hypothetical protein
MALKKRFFLGTLLILLAALLAILLAPFAVSRGLRMWISWHARQQNLTVKIDKIDAPLLRPVVIRGIHVTSAPANAFRIDLSATQATIDLNLTAIVLRMRERAIRTLSVEGLRAEMRRNHPGKPMSASGWNALQKSLPGKFNFDRFDLRVEDGPTVIFVRKASLSGSEIEAGRFTAGEIAIESPWFRQTFAQLRGATNWQGNRLIVAGLSLTRGLDLQSIAVDLAHLDKQRVELDFDVDAFGGKIRASILNDWHPRPSAWNLVGSANDVSLAQTSEALGFTDRIGGLLHACKFTFRGDPSDPTNATASVWTELTELSWRNRAAEVIMFGAALYNRQVDIQQIYVKQSKNQLTLSGEAAFPAKSSDWLSPDFRGDISAAINQLGDFAALFGANPGDFAGKIAIEGTMNARDRKIGGHLMLDGTSLTLFKTGIDSLSAKLNLKTPELEIAQLELKRKKDSLSAQGKIDMSHEHNYSGTLNATVDNLAEYVSIFRGPAENKSQPTPANLQATIDSSRWNTRGAIGLPGSSPLNFTANFLFAIGKDWNAFMAAPLDVTLDFPSIFLASAPQFFHPEIFRDGILSGKISLSETLQHPHLVGDVQLLNGKLQNVSFNLVEASSRITFDGIRASIDFFNAATKDVDLSFRGDIDLHDTNDLAIKITGATPIFDLTPRTIDCVSKIEIGSVAATLAPAVTELTVRGPLFQSAWTMSLKERASTQSVSPLNLNETARKFPFCSTGSAEEKTLLLGAPPRPEKRPETVHPKKRKKRS